ncbi:MAG: leucine-rich repeat protein [Eubacterium sp.]|nr:leucine-rich repeat protein [Eubacterium sp.]
MKTKVTKLLSVILTFVMLTSTLSAFAITANAEPAYKTTKIKGIAYTYYIKDGTACVLYATAGSSIKNVIKLASRIKGKKIKTIGYIETRESKAKTLIIPNCVERVGPTDRESLTGVTSFTLETIKIGTGLKTIKFNPFCCGKNFVVAKGNKHFSSEKGVLYNKNKTALYAYPADRKAKSVTIKRTVKTIKERAFCYSNVKTINLNNVEKVESDVFYRSKVTKVKLGAKLKYFTAEAFSNYEYSLKKIELNKKNKHFKLKNGVLFNKDCTKLVLYPPYRQGKTYRIPKTVKTVGKNAFYTDFDSKKLKKVIVPSSVTVVESGAFASDELEANIPSKVKIIGNRAYRGSGIKNAKLPKTVTSLGYEAFCSCFKLTSVDISKAKIKTIKQFTFCATNVESVTIPKSVKTVKMYAFDSDKLKRVTVKGKDTELKRYAIGNYAGYEEKPTVVAPKGSKAEKFAKKYKFNFEVLK